MANFFGNSQTVNTTGEIASSKFSVVRIGGAFNLGQNVQMQYGQQIETKTEIGSTNVYFIPGTAVGQLIVERLVGTAGFFANWDTAACGSISDLNISVTNSTCYKGSGEVTFGTGMIESIKLSLTAQNTDVNEGCTIRIADVEVLSNS